MGRGGRGGGHRSSGGHHSSHRSSGGRSSSHRSRGSSSSHSSWNSSGGGSGSHHIHHHHTGYSNNSAAGCIVFFIIFSFVALSWILSIFEIIALHATQGSSDHITRSTIEREALPKGSVDETGYYTDELGWIDNSYTLETGLRNFYKKTGVQPYIYITDNINGEHEPSDAEFDAFAQAKYDELFTDEAHFLLIFHEYYESEYTMWYVTGNQARSVMDTEACDIVMDYLERYYYSDYSDEEFFSLAFDKAGERIMRVTVSPWVYILGGVIVLTIIILLFVWWKKVKKQKNLEAEQTERILSTPLETFGDTTIDTLTGKYDDPQ